MSIVVLYPLLLQQFYLKYVLPMSGNGRMYMLFLWRKGQEYKGNTGKLSLSEWGHHVLKKITKEHENCRTLAGSSNFYKFHDIKTNKFAKGKSNPHYYTQSSLRDSLVLQTFWGHEEIRKWRRKNQYATNERRYTPKNSWIPEQCE